MAATCRREQQILLLWVPVNQPISIRRIEVPAQSRSDKVALAELGIYLAKVLPKPLEHLERNETAFSSWRQDCSRHRHTGLGTRFVVYRVGVGFVRLVCIALVVDGTLDDVFGSRGEDVEASLHVENLRAATVSVSLLMRATVTYDRVFAVPFSLFRCQLQLGHTLTAQPTIVSHVDSDKARACLPGCHNLRQLLHSILSKQSWRPRARRDDHDITQHLFTGGQFDALDGFFAPLALLLDQAANLTSSSDDSSILVRDPTQTNGHGTTGFGPAGLRIQVGSLVVELAQAGRHVRVLGGWNDGRDGVAK
jgi:hypothetical protein